MLLQLLLLLLQLLLLFLFLFLFLCDCVCVRARVRACACGGWVGGWVGGADRSTRRGSPTCGLGSSWGCTGPAPSRSRTKRTTLSISHSGARC